MTTQLPKVNIFMSDLQMKSQEDLSNEGRVLTLLFKQDKAFGKHNSQIYMNKTNRKFGRLDIIFTFYVYTAPRSKREIMAWCI